MREPQRRPFPQHKGKQLDTAQYQSQHLQQSILPVMTPHLSVSEIGLSSQFADLKRVTGRQHDCVPAFPKFPDDRLEEGNMGSIVQIDPNLFRYRSVK